MESIKRRWRNVPASIRKPVVLIIGCLFILAAGLTGWLPGPGGIPLFLIGIAVLATEFEWAKTVRDWVIERIHEAGKAFRKHKIIGSCLIVVGIAIVGTLSYIGYTHFHHK
jgi:hypothetical protein